MSSLKQRITFHHDVQPSHTRTTNFSTAIPLELAIDARSHRPLGRLLDFLGKFSGQVLIAAETIGRRAALLEVLATANLHPTSVTSWQEFLASNEPLAITVAPLEQGLVLQKSPLLAVVTEHQLFGEQVMQRRRRDRDRKGRDAEAIIRDLTEPPYQNEIESIYPPRATITTIKQR